MTKDSFGEFPVEDAADWHGPLTFIFVEEFYIHRSILSDLSCASGVHKQPLISYCCRPDQSTCSCQIPKRISKCLDLRKRFFLIIWNIGAMPDATVTGRKKIKENKSRISLVFFCWQDTRSTNKLYLIVQP